MNFIQKIFGKKEDPIATNAQFWNWFEQNEKTFYNVLNNKHADVEADFFDRLSPKLEELKSGYYFLAGMFDDDTAELIITVDGDARNIVFAEELIAEAPQIKGWKFTALKQPESIENLEIRMNEYVFNSENIHFLADQLLDYPDEIAITIVCDLMNDSNREIASNCAYIFVDNFLGELDSLISIDNLNIVGRHEASGELIPISRLKAYLIWRQKEFVEKYEGVRHDAENDLYATFEATLQNGNPLIAVMNTTLLEWDAKASHPWIVILTIKYDGSDNNGMPDNEDYAILNELEDEIMLQLKDENGYLNLGRQTADNEREIYFACTEFRQPSKVLYAVQKRYEDRFEIRYEIYKDKYWKWFDRFRS